MTTRVPMTEQEEHTASREGHLFRSVIGFVCIGASVAGFAGLYFIEIPAVNRDALMLALGYIFGWGSAVVQSEYGASTTGRKVAESALKKLDSSSQDVNVTNTPSEPVPTIAKKEK